jgi:hypothetical protein
MTAFTVRTPFRSVQKCIEAINKIDVSILNEISDMIRTKFIEFLKHRYGTEVYELSNDPLEVEGDFIILALTDARWLFAYICGASYELEHRYKIEISAQPRAARPQVRFDSWIPMRCSVLCTLDYDSNNVNKPARLTLMPMTAAILHFPETVSKTVRIRVVPEPL